MSKSNLTLALIVAALRELRIELDKVPPTAGDEVDAGIPNYIRPTSDFTIGASVRGDLAPISFRDYINKYLNDTIAAVGQATRVVESSAIFEDIVRNFFDFEDIVRNFFDVEEDVTNFILEFGPAPSRVAAEEFPLPNVGPQRGPSSVAKIEAETKAVKKELAPNEGIIVTDKLGNETL